MKHENKNKKRRKRNLISAKVNWLFRQNINANEEIYKKISILLWHCTSEYRIVNILPSHHFIRLVCVCDFFL